MAGGLGTQRHVAYAHAPYKQHLLGEDQGTECRCTDLLYLSRAYGICNLIVLLFFSQEI